jgi:hypothetical protein
VVALGCYAQRALGPKVPVPIRLSVNDDLKRSRLTVFFRFLLALPHLLWLALWGSLAVLVALASSIATVITGRSPDMFHNFIASFVRYATHVMAYLLLAANPFPGFAGKPGSYPIDLEIDGPQRQNRWVTGFRLVLALPALLLADVLLGGSVSGATQVSAGAGSTAALLGWFACLARRRMPQGLRNLVAFGLAYTAQTYGYLLLLTDRYPVADPAIHLPSESEPPHPVRLSVEDDLRRSRLTVFFRFLLALPHLVWLTLWSLAVWIAVIANWFVTLLRGRPAAPLHRFSAAFLRYGTHVYAYLYLLGNPFPGFTGRPGSYPIELAIDAPQRQNRWVTGFRFLLAIPALLVAAALGTVLSLVAVFGWFVGLARARMPKGLRNLGSYCLRYTSQLWGYLMLLHDRYPYAGPSVPGAASALAGEQGPEQLGGQPA